MTYPKTLLLFLLAISVSSAQATVIIPKSLEKRVSKAADIFEGKVVGKVVKLSANGHMIYTEVSFQVDSAIKGNSARNVRKLLFPGGELDGEELLIPGMPTFEIGEHVILFVKPGGRKMICPLVGWRQGKFTVEVDPIHRKEVVRDGQGLTVLSDSTRLGDIVVRTPKSSFKNVPVPIFGSTDKLVRSDSKSMKGSQNEAIRKESFVQLLSSLVEKLPKQKTPLTTTRTLSGEEVWEYSPVSAPSHSINPKLENLR